MNRYACPLLLTLVLAASAGAVAAPVPKSAGPTPNLATLKAALGKVHLSKELRDVIRAVGEPPTFHPGRLRFDDPGRKDDGKDDIDFELRWKTRGVEMHFVFGKLAGIFLYNKGEEGFDRYRGELPGGVLWGDDLAAIERKLGEPDKRRENLNKKIDGNGKLHNDPSMLHDELELGYGDWKGLRITIILRRAKGEPYALRFVHLTEPKKE